MQRPLISIVVPVYKVEPYLERCVESLVGQTWENLEIILVDDGSPDRCGALCDEWAKRDPRVRVLHKKNGGLSDARNRGVELVTGDYVSFVDSDDYLAPDAIAYLYSLIEGQRENVAVASWREVHGDGERFENQPPEAVARLSPEQACLDLMGNQERYMQLVTAWGKLYPTQLVRANPFPKGRLHEDEATTYRYYDQSSGAALGTREIYAYYQNSASITHTKTARNREAVLQAFVEQIDYFAGRGEEKLRLAAADRLLNVLVDLADRGDGVCRAWWDSNRPAEWMLPGLRLKTRLRVAGYRLLRVDLNKLYHKILGR